MGPLSSLFGDPGPGYVNFVYLSEKKKKKNPSFTDSCTIKKKKLNCIYFLSDFIISFLLLNLGLICSSFFFVKGASLVVETAKNLPAMQETWVQSLSQEDPLEKGMATHSSVLAWKIPCTEEPRAHGVTMSCIWLEWLTLSLSLRLFICHFSCIFMKDFLLWTSL